MLDLVKLTSFVAVVDAGSFTAAGKALGLTKAAVSAHVRHLEDDLGCNLVVRSTRRLAPTEAGERLHAAGSALLLEAERVESQAKQQMGLSGTLRITSTNEYASTVLTPALASFLRAHPRLRLELHGGPSLADVVAERFDLAVRFGRPASSALRATQLSSFRLLPLAIPELVSRFGVPTEPNDLLRYPWVLHRAHLNPTTWRRGDEVRTVTLSARVVSDVIDANRRLALEGVGAILGADWRVQLQEDIAAGRLVRLLPEWSLPAIPIYAVRPPSTHVPPKVRALIQYLKDALA
ncbi:LysR family transcriptional regulator [Pendulispora albinea]|uniref:LysR family transcriptional regulator n=1 Tax=Pendulispora albinea TaxID=2741071 RepID=A0ABZ2M1X7_9BACT